MSEYERNEDRVTIRRGGFTYERQDHRYDYDYCKREDEDNETL